MDFFEMMKLISQARERGSNHAWEELGKWLKAHPNYPSLPGGIEAAIETARRRYEYRQWRKKKI